MMLKKKPIAEEKKVVDGNLDGRIQAGCSEVMSLKIRKLTKLNFFTFSAYEDSKLGKKSMDCSFFESPTTIKQSIQNLVEKFKAVIFKASRAKAIRTRTRQNGFLFSRP